MNKGFYISIILFFAFMSTLITFLLLRSSVIENVGEFKNGDDVIKVYYISRGSQSCLISSIKHPDQDRYNYFFDCVK